RVEAFSFIDSFNIKKYKKVVFKSLTSEFLAEDKISKKKGKNKDTTENSYISNNGSGIVNGAGSINSKGEGGIKIGNTATAAEVVSSSNEASPASATVSETATAAAAATAAKLEGKSDK
ncbi:MAG: hypothetical protein PHG48_04550, partial [Eubacteriales bacterium]|nr:hypothetical protein [Eubacteriales bacterium]